jgi:hypothetical protein
MLFHACIITSIEKFGFPSTATCVCARTPITGLLTGHYRGQQQLIISILLLDSSNIVHFDMDETVSKVRADQPHLLPS